MSGKLERKLGLFSVTNIVIANIIGAGIFTTTGYVMGLVNNPVVMIALWVISGFIALCGALAFGELGAAYPEAGGEYIFISKLFNPLLGFLSGWSSLIVGFSAPIAASAIGFSKYFVWALPGLQQWFCLDEAMSAESFSRLLAILVILIFSFLHAQGTRSGARVQNVLTIVKILLVVVLIVAGFSFGKGNWENVKAAADFQFNFSGWKSIGLSLLFISFAYSGWSSATYIGSEIRNPARVIPWSLLISTGVVVVFYVLLNLFFVYAIPLHQMVGEPEIGALAARNAFGGTAEIILSLLIAFALFSSLSAFIILGPRVYYQMAQDGYFFKRIASVNPKTKVPANAVALQGAIAIIMVLSGTFEQILTYMGFSLGIFPILAVAGVFKLRLQKKSVLKMPGYPLVHIIFILVGIGMLTLAYFERPAESTIAVLTVLSGIPVFYWFKKRKDQASN